ncbi:MAG TPA: PIG-L family deacetylase [Kofleriaceae bacterium]
MRILIVAAHPDDETIGASALLGPPHEVVVLHATDGASRDPRWWPAEFPDRGAYARVRALEAERALAIGGAERVALAIADQEAVHAVPQIARAVAGEIARRAPDVIVTHAYEGGHPDHDAVAVAVAIACRRARRAPRVHEMALYHGAPGHVASGHVAPGAFVAGEFIADRTSICHVLDPEQQRRRRAMLDCFASQRTTLAPFLALGHERFRPAPRYDFSRPPHDGLLLYERMGFAMTGMEWRALASAHGEVSYM